MFYTEKKFIIVKRYNRLEHYIFPSSHFHDNFAHDNGFNYNDVLETGIIRNHRIIIVECRVKAHLPRVQNKSLFSEQELTARACESRYLYREKVYSLPDGD